jgi:hypothetical protein
MAASVLVVDQLGDHTEQVRELIAGKRPHSVTYDEGEDPRTVETATMRSSVRDSNHYPAT